MTKEDIYNLNLSEKSIGSLAGVLEHIRLQLDVEELKYKEAIAPLKAAETKVLGEARTKMLEQGLDNVKTPYGTLYFYTVTRFKVVNREDFHNWVLDNRAVDVLTTNLSSRAIQERGIIPPGVETDTYIDLRLRSE